MKLISIARQTSNTAYGKSFDLLLVGLGYEQRCIAIASKHHENSTEKTAWAFNDRQVLSFTENREWFRRNGFEILNQDDSEFLGFLEGKLQSLRGGADSTQIHVAIDISCLTRVRIAVVLSSLAKLRLACEIRITFFYVIAQFSPPPSEHVPNQFAGPVHSDFSGWYVDPGLPLSVVLGLGYEQDKALGAVELLEADSIWAFIPSSAIGEYQPLTLAANKTLLDLIPVERRLPYDVHNPARTLMSLASLASGLKRDHNVLLVPFGPKLFALVCLLQGLLDENLAVWRVSAGELEAPSQRLSSEHTIAVETLFVPDFEPNAQEC